MSIVAASTSVRIRRAMAEDAGVCGRICYEAFTGINREHNFQPELPAPEAAVGLLGMLFAHPGFYCVVAELDGRVVGSNCLDERSTVAGIGPITVDPACQNRSIGRTLMQAVLDRSHERQFPGLRLLQATFHNRSLALYTKMGFAPRALMSVMNGPPIRKAMEGCVVRPASAADIPRANRVCEKVHGHNRAGELRDAVVQGTALVVERQGRITGYASGFGYFGHAAGETTLDVQALLAVAHDFGGPGIIVPVNNAELFRWCLESGLRVLQPMTLMTIGLYNEPAGAYLPSVLY